MRKLKLSSKQYRNINGIRYNCHTSNPDQFDILKNYAKLRLLKYRIIDEQFYLEVITDFEEHSKKIANKIRMPYCWEDIKNRLEKDMELPYTLNDIRH